MKIRHMFTILALPLATLALTGCSSNVSGQGTTAPTSSTAPPASSTPTNNPLSSLDPCKVIDQAVTGQGYPPGQSSKVVLNQGPNCETQKSGIGTDSILFQDGLTIDANLPTSGQISRGTINNRRAAQAREALGLKDSCSVAMEVKPNSRAIVIVTLTTGTTDQACQAANDLAIKVDPLLP